jgi:SAM-dependent methyltransferase
MTNDYPMNIEDPTETARLIEQDRLFTQAMGGLFAEREDVASMHIILDLACGPGSWALDVAFEYPRSEVIGVDLSQTMIEYAHARAMSQKRANATFETMDITQRLQFADASVDLINARCIQSFFSLMLWPALLAECRRILKPGGVLRLTEIEGGLSNSVPLQQLSACLFDALRLEGRTFSIDGRSLGIVHMLGPLLKNAGFQDIGKRPFVLDTTYDEPLYYVSSENIKITFFQLKPYLLASGLISEQVFDEAYRQLVMDLYDQNFVCLSFGITAWGVKP